MDELRAESDLTAFRHEIAEMIVEVLVLVDVTPEQIQPSEPLFGDGLGLDSIDALEISFALAKRYGVKLRSEDENNQKIFASLDSLARHVQEHRTK